MKQNPTNPIVRLLSAITDVVNQYIAHPAGKKDMERAVNIGAIWQTVQKHLDETAEVGEDGMRSFAYVLDIYDEQAGVFAIITKSDGKLYKVPVAVDAESRITLGEMVEVVMDFTPVTARQVVVKRQTDGKVRWFAMPACTAVLNRTGEIDSRALFDSFVEYTERTESYPELDFFHLGENLTLGKADWVARDGFTYCASGLFYDTPIARAAAKSLEDNPDYWGLSIAYLPTGEPEILRSSEGVEIPVFNAGINRFISLLPEDTAASILTSISTKEEVNRMNKKVLDALKVLTGGDDTLLKQLEEKVDGINRSADGMINRETPTPAAPAAPSTPVVRELTDDDITKLLDSDAFKEKVRLIISEEMTTESNEETETATEEAKRSLTPAPAAAPDPTLSAIQALADKVDALSKSRDAEVQEVLNDLPARISRQNIIRPRATPMPSGVRSDTGKVSLADIAAKTMQTLEMEES